MLAATALIALPLAGCTTTQQEAQRVRLDSARLRAALAGTRVLTQSSTVRPTEVLALSSGTRTALVVTVHNGGRREVTDLPISVGYYRTGRTARVYLNATAGLDYYDAHLPAIPSGSRLTWVFTTAAKLPAHARLFATVGSRESVPARLTDPNVRLEVRIGRRPGNGEAVTVRLDNPSSVPQYQLQLYATVGSAGHYVAAGDATVADLAAGSTQKVKLALVGRGAGGRLRVTAAPTVLQ